MDGQFDKWPAQISYVGGKVDDEINAEWATCKEDHEMSGDEIKLSCLGVPANPNLHGTVDPSTLHELLPLDNDKVKIRAVPTERLNIFPLDIWMELFDVLDIMTLTLLRRVCKSFRSMIDDMPSYRLIYEQVPELLRASIVSGVGSFFSIADLHRAYRSTRCGIRNCANDGEFIYLLELHRICYTHLRRIKLFALPQSLKMLFADSDHHVRGLPRMDSLLARLILIFLDKNRINAAQRRRTLPAWLYTNQVNLPDSSPWHILGSCLRIPWFDSATARPSWGFHCAVEYRPGPELPSEDIYSSFPRKSIMSRSAKSILKHFEKCEAAQRKWKEYALMKGISEE